MALKRLSALSAGVAALALFGAAAAQDDQPAQQALFLSPAGKPYRAPLDKPYPAADWFAAADADHDGKLTKAEFRADAEAFFNELDRNKDGVLDSGEVSRYEKVIAPEIIATFSPDSGQSAPLGDEPQAPHKANPQGGAWFNFFDEPEPVSDTDGNFDGVITKSEFLKANDERFALLDTQHKGYVTLDQLPKTPSQETLERMNRKKRRR